MRKDSIAKLINAIARAHQRTLGKALKEHGLGTGGYHGYLVSVLKNPGINQDQVTSLLKFDKATTTRNVRLLEEAGFIERRVDPEDRRSYLLYPTKRALDFEEPLQQLLKQSNEELTRSLTAEEKELLLSLLQKIYQDTYEQS